MSIRPLLYITFFIVVIMVGLATLEYFGIIWHTTLFTYPYPVKGLDVSHHQNTIDWTKVAQHGQYQFVFIKATEGHDFIDEKFADNWHGAKQHGLRVGAYHFFSMRSSGETQAEYFMAVVPQDNSALPPVIDVEIATNLDREKVRKELRDLAERLEKHYGKRPMFYVTYDTYDAYIKGQFDNYPLWIRDIFKPPSLDAQQLSSQSSSAKQVNAQGVGTKQGWLFWQYNSRGRVEGISTYVDINVFAGSSEELSKL